MTQDPYQPYQPPASPHHAVPEPGTTPYPVVPQVPVQQQPVQHPAPYPNPYAAPYPPNPYAAPYALPQRTSPSGMYVAAAVINWVVLGFVVLGTCGLGILAAAWFIPMTIQLHKGARDGRKHTALGVCTLLFCNIVSGILVLIDDANRPADRF